MAAIAFAIGLLAASIAALPWSESARLWLEYGIKVSAFRFGVGAVGGYLVLEFMGRPLPYRFFVPLVAVGAVVAYVFLAITSEISSPIFGVLMLALGPVGGIAMGWFATSGSIGLLVAAVLLVLSARTESRTYRVYFLFLFGVLWLMTGLVTAALSTFTV